MPNNPFAALDSDEEDRKPRQAKPAAERKTAPAKPRRRAPPSGRAANDYSARRDNRGAERRNRNRDHARGSGAGGRGRGPHRGREFDRHVSGTGRGRGMKRDGRGPRNWGTDDATAEALVSADVEAAKGDDVEGDDVAAAAAPEEEGETLQTLEEYEAEMAAKRRHADAFESRETAEIENSVSGTVLAKDTADIEEMYSFEYKGKKRSGRSKSGAASKRGAKNLDDVFRTKGYAEPERDFGSRRGGRGGRFEGGRGRGGPRRDGPRRDGGGRGRGFRGGRGAFRGGRGGARRFNNAGGARVNITDTAAFPALG